MKKLLALLLLISLPNFAYTYTLEHMASIDSYVYNSSIDYTSTERISVYAGSDGKHATVRIIFPMYLENYDLDFKFKKKKIETLDNYQYQDFISSISKSIEWSLIAMENKVNVNKKISDRFDYDCWTCEMSFRSINEGEQVYLGIKMRDFEFSSAEYRTFYIDYANQILLLEILKKVPFYFSKTEKNSKKADELFN